MCTNQGTLEAVIVPAVCVCKDAVLVLQAAIAPDWRVVYGREGTTERPGCWKWGPGKGGLGFPGE